MPQPLYVFDAYGTLFDVNAAVMRHAAEIGPSAARLAELWRAKQLEHSWVRSLMGRPRDFWSLTEAALQHAADLCGGLSDALRHKLLAAYEELDAYPDVRPTLDALRHSGARTAILSNGSPPMLSKAVAAAGLADAFDAVISVEATGVYKTDPRTYKLVTDRFGVAPDDVLFVSSNRWDVAGAKAFGFRPVWINRSRQPDDYLDLPPLAVLKSLNGLLTISLDPPK